MAAREATSRRTYGTGSLYVVTNAAGREQWYGQWRHDGRQIKRALGPKRRTGTSDGMTRRTAEAKLREMMATLTADDIQSTTTRALRPGEVTIAGLWATFKADRGRELKRSTLHDYDRCVANWLEPHFADTPIHRITRDDVNRLVDAMVVGRHRKRGDRAGLAPKSMRNYVTLLSTLLNYAIREKRWITENVASGVTVPSDENDDTDELHFLEAHVVTDVVNAAAGHELYGQVDAAMILTAAMAGMRQGELLALRWESVDFTGSRLRAIRGYVRGEETSTKGKRRRSVPMAPPVAAALAALRDATGGQPDDLVFASPITARQLSRSPLMKRYRKALVAAGVAETFRYHDLRHTFGTRMAAAGVEVRTIQAWMGHSQLSTTERYMHYAPAHNDADRIAAAFASADPRTAVREVATVGR